MPLSVKTFVLLRKPPPAGGIALMACANCPEKYNDRPEAVPARTQRVTTALEGMIRRNPEQSF